MLNRQNKKKQQNTKLRFPLHDPLIHALSHNHDQLHSKTKKKSTNHTTKTEIAARKTQYQQNQRTSNCEHEIQQSKPTNSQIIIQKPNIFQIKKNAPKISKQKLPIRKQTDREEKREHTICVNNERIEIEREEEAT